MSKIDEILGIAGARIIAFAAIVFTAVNISAIKLLDKKKKIPSIISAILIVLYWGIWISNLIING